MSQIENRISAGGVSAVIWNNKKEMNGQEIDMKTVSVQRTYKDKNGDWKHSTSFRITDIPKVRLVLDKAYEQLLVR